ncbi:helix-turn-helix domain-containing protein [Streptococcus merionis]|uniref:helix-turn-helix domain-containing protein n=1 Tax=Streptococcus merionis TaxID=400065 RepID=UPI003510F25D
MKHSISSRLSHLREDSGKEKQDLARYLGITPRSYSRYETGERTPDLSVLICLAEYFNCSVDYLLGRERSNSLNVIDREDALCYKDITQKGYNGKLAHGLIKEIIEKQSYQERVHLSDNDSVKYVSKDHMRQLLMRMLAEIGE